VQGVQFHHTLIGDGVDRDRILGLIKELDLTQSCIWLGTQTHAEVLRHFQKSDLFLLSCRVAADGDRDGIPNVLVESLAMGVPAVSTEVSAIPELIEHQRTGLLVPPGDSDAMAEAILRLLSESELRGRCIKEGRLRVREEFDNRILISNLADVFTCHIQKTGSTQSLQE
jgi:glycosyltransferase involved in cell wall biosynthesis